MSNKINTAIDMYTQIDDKIKLLEKEARKLRQQKNKLESYIMNTIEANNLQNKEIKVNNSTKIKYNTTVRKEPMSQKYIRNSLEQYYLDNFGNKLSKTRCEEKACEIYNYLNNSRKDKNYNQLKIIHT